MSGDFKEYVTSTAFNLTLTRRMCEVLDAIGSAAEQGSDDFGLYAGYSHFVPTVHCLQRRGLVTHHDWKKDPLTGGRPAGWISHRLTPAGEHVLALVRMAGLGMQATQRQEAA